MENNTRQISSQQQRSRRSENERKRRQNISNEQRENNLSRRRENYRRRKEQEKQAQTSRPINSQSRGSFQNFTNMTFPRSHFQGTHDSEADPSRITHVNDVALDRNCTSPNQRNNTSQSDTDDMDVDEALEDAVISYVNMDARENGAVISDVLNNERNSKTMLTQFFALNLRDPQARKYLYREILEHYCWNKRGMEWHRRRSTRKVIGRIYTVSPSEGDKFYLRLLLSHVTGLTSWEYLLTNNGMTFSTFKKSAEDRGFLETDHSIRDCLVEATSLRMPYALRRLFVTILIFCEPTDVRGLWNEFFTHMVEDYQTANNVVESDLTNMLLKDLNELLNLHGKKIDDYDLPSLPPNTIDRGAVPSIIQEELAIDIPNEDIESIAKLNNDQMIAFNTIMNVIVQKHSGVFFVDGPGGTGKTFLYRTLMASLRSRGEIVLATASSGIAATLLPGGRSAHSRFKIPIDIQPSSICGIKKQKDLANLIRVAAAIIWDEAPMKNKNCLEALDRSLQDICSNNAPFEFLIRIGDGVEPTKPDDMVRLPLHIAIPWEGEHSIQKLNDMIIDQFPGEEHNLLSFDEVEGDNHNLYQQEFLNSIAQDRNCTSPNQQNITSQSDTDDMDVDEALEDAVISYVNMDARENGALSRRPQESGHAFRAKHNIARNFKNNMMMAKARLPHPFTCRHCNARLFHHESRDTCCNGGKVSFSRVDAPIVLQQLFLDGSAEGKHFRQHIRSYNHWFHSLQLVFMLMRNSCIWSWFKQLSILPNISECSLILKERPRNHHQYNLPTAEQVAAIIVGCDADSLDYGRDINVIRCDGNLKKVQETKGYYDPLQYPVLFPFGTLGWDINTTNCNGRRVSCRAYYSYMLQIRPNDQSMLLNAGRLLQQYVVDNYVKIESGRLRWIKEHQSDIRSELYQGLHDALHVGETNAENIGKRTILPSSFIGSRRDMTQRYEDGMAIVLNGGKPDIFLTMTCNPSWSEITSELLPFQTPQDRPDLLTRIFRSKFEKLKDDVINKGVLGKVKSYMYVTEFQKRGLPHVHMLLVLESNDKLRDPKDYDSMVRAEIPKLECEPQLHEAVVRHMIHRPCGIINRKSPCMKDGHCKKRYPKQFLDETRQGTDSYPEYRRRFDESVSLGKDRSVDNRWVVPYNPWLLLKYDCHINVEICSSIKSIKYLYKYVYKGPDRVAMEVHKGSYMDEVQQYVDARWICAPEALWKIFDSLFTDYILRLKDCRSTCRTAIKCAFMIISKLQMC
ncbi:hypothetical protein KIW84_064601 [Lathyrus oleraceus]|uniref:ATP-dependent DNA helicase n=1 Tax=Pisum sativum TaxID=3888 RepID=A0A9D4WEI6_PEA|nr:hypothetical protein KIW84_064601 [Pisum sativum]